MDIFTNIELIDKWYLLLFILLPFILYFFFKKEKAGISFIFLNEVKKTFHWNSFKFYLKIILLCLIMINYIIIIANPNIVNTSKDIQKNGIDIVIALDISGSMEAEDLKPNRIVAAKNVIEDFIWKLKTDRLWLVVFAWKPFTSIPLTFDYNILKETISRLWTENISQEKRGLWGTAIWDAILMSKTLFKAPKDESEDEYKKREKVIILLTDWDANAWVEPTLAWLLAKKEWIKIYTIWIWSKQGWVITYGSWPFMRQVKVSPLNDTILKQIALDTSWEYFRADSNKTFRKIFKELEKLEKNDINIEIKKEYSEYYSYLIYALMILLSLFTYFMITNLEIRQKK